MCVSYKPYKHYCPNVRGNQTSKMRGRGGGVVISAGVSVPNRDARWPDVRRQEMMYDIVSYQISRGRSDAGTSLCMWNGANVLDGTPTGKGRGGTQLPRPSAKNRIMVPVADSFTLFYFGHGPNAFPLGARKAVFPFANKVLRRYHCECNARSVTISSPRFLLKRDRNAP